MSDMLVEEYRPETYSEIYGQDEIIKYVADWAENYQTIDGAVLLEGPPGTGKTSIARATANEFGWPIAEINASDSRRKEDVEEMKGTLVSTPPEAEHRIVLVDEVDSWQGSSASTLAGLIDRSPNPVVLTANESWEIPDSLQKIADEEYEVDLNQKDQMKRLRDVRDGEDIDISSEEMRSIAKRPDLRSAINDLQTYAITGETRDDGRDWEDSPFSAMDDLNEGDPSWSEDMKPPEMVRWADANLVEDYSDLELGMAYEALAAADVQLERAGREDYRYWRWASELASVAARMRLSDPYEGWIRWSAPDWYGGGVDSEIEDLYRELRSGDRYSFACSLSEFAYEYVPLLLELSVEERVELIIETGVEEGFGALGLDEDEVLEVAEEAPEASTWEPDSGAADDW